MMTPSTNQRWDILYEYFSARNHQTNKKRTRAKWTAHRRSRSHKGSNREHTYTRLVGHDHRDGAEGVAEGGHQRHSRCLALALCHRKKRVGLRAFRARVLSSSKRLTPSGFPFGWLPGAPLLQTQPAKQRSNVRGKGQHYFRRYSVSPCAVLLCRHGTAVVLTHYAELVGVRSLRAGILWCSRRCQSCDK